LPLPETPQTTISRRIEVDLPQIVDRHSAESDRSLAHGR
jgi:hypothetical protein